jgi:hypothetical protein
MLELFFAAALLEPSTSQTTQPVSDSLGCTPKEIIRIVNI